MADLAQLSSQIRFALEQLSERNAQHDWEHICRYLASQRICANILPATGPVQAGGDQGRDFETFRTYLARNKKGRGIFLGLISEKPLVFACTLEKRIEGKVRRDVATIMSAGTPVEGVYFFCSRDLPVAKRHALQEWARSTYKIPLEILDGQAVAEHLSGQDTVWIAERFLHLPAELRPIPPTEESDWYTRALEKWQHTEHQAGTYADLVEICAAGRIALGPFAYGEDGHPRHQYERSELPFWVERLDELTRPEEPAPLRRKALYEASVLRLRGFGTLIGQEDRLRHYFAEIAQLNDAAELENADVLLTYVLTATAQGLTCLEARELEGWFATLKQQLDVHLQVAKEHGRVNKRCALLEIRGHVALFGDLFQGKRTIDATAALTYWSELGNLAAHAPLFPLERFADRLAEYARYIGSHPDYDPLIQVVDALVAERFGQFKAAEKCLARAKAFRKSGDLPRAMAHLHRAKIDWFAEETLGRSIAALSLLSNSYEEQGLFFAAKYYALAAAYVAVHANDLRLRSAIAPCLESAATDDYAMGAWHSFLELAETMAICYPQFARDPEADARDPNHAVNQLLFYLGLVPVATQYLHPTLLSFARERCRQVAAHLDLVDVLEEVGTSAEATWSARGQDKLLEAVEEQLAGPLWSDAGPERHVQWKAHGVTWLVQWANTYEMTLSAEEFLSALQITLSDLANYDLCLMRTTVQITLRLAPDDIRDLTSHVDEPEYFDIEFEPSNAERRATIMLPSYQMFRDERLSHQDLQIGVLSVISALLAEVSLLPRARFHEVLADRLGQGLQNKLHIGAPYGQCFRTFVTQDEFNASTRATHPPFVPSQPFTSHLSEQLPWVDGPGPGYTQEVAHEHLQNRYEGFARPIARTLRRLAQDPTFQETLKHLRTDGWKDWHILATIFHATINYRLDHRRIVLPSAEAEQAATERLINQPEPEEALQVSITEYSEEKLREHINMFMVSFAKTYGLEIRQFTPDLPALEDFLARRYNFWSDDIEHDEHLFTPSETER